MELTYLVITGRTIKDMYLEVASRPGSPGPHIYLGMCGQEHDSSGILASCRLCLYTAKGDFESRSQRVRALANPARALEVHVVWCG